MQLKDFSSKPLPDTPITPPAAQAPGEKTVGTMIDHLELLRYIVATNRENTQKIRTWHGKADVQVPISLCTQRRRKPASITPPRWSSSSIGRKNRSAGRILLNRYSRINDSADDPQPVPQILNGMLTPEAFYRYGSLRFARQSGRPKNESVDLLVSQRADQPVSIRFQSALLPGNGVAAEVAKDISGYLNMLDQPGITGIKIMREGDNVTVDHSLRDITQYYTVSLSQGCNPIRFRNKRTHIDLGIPLDL